MKIYDSLKNKCDNSDNSVIKNLHIIAQDVVGKIVPHLKQITLELPEFDIHDETHSEKVIENIEQLLGDKLDELSAYELFFMYLSAYLHDAAMALPAWERKLLKLTEGQAGFCHNDVDKPLLYDGKPPMKLSEAKEYIIENKNLIYGNFENCKDYILSFKTEEELTNDLSEQLSEYQDYRNGYIHRLNEAKSDIQIYLKLSDEIRYEYIRENHSMRIEKLINNLSSAFDAKLDVKIGKMLTKTLGVICKSHGEPYNYVKDQGFEDTYSGKESVNTQFICMMLRLGDILHFSYDRAPDSLYAEKLISSAESRKQWKVKSQVGNNIVNSDGVVRIKYDAFCEVPSFYYYLNDYISWIEDEISNYNKMIKAMSQSTEFSKLKSRYEINISDTVDKKGVKYDDDIFEPVNGLCFKLNQSKILELLMGTNLYKDKFLCLREIYQNAMDTCRNMIGYNPGHKGYIEFGMDEETVDGVNRKFLYCMDNGMGMTLDIINKYFLNIGNSYYKSKDFYRENTKNGDGFMPTSQFGIGVLSCFMICNKIYVATKHRSDSTFTRFMIDGPHEKFYYVKGNKFDDKENQINEHGTIIKLYLKNDIIINDNVVSYSDIIDLSLNSYLFVQRNGEEKEKQIYNNLLHILQSFIRYVQDNISVKIRLQDKKLYDLIQINNLVIALEKIISKEQIAWIIYSGDPENEIEKKVNDFFSTYEGKLDTLEIAASYEGIEFKSKLALPKEKIDMHALNIFNKHLSTMFEVLIDGISVNDISYITERFFNTSYRIFMRTYGFLNFTGEIRPQLSVDRNSITDIGPSVEEGLINLRKFVAAELFGAVKKHIRSNNIEDASEAAMDIWKYVFNEYEWLAEELVTEIIKNEDIQVYLEEVNKAGMKALTVRELIECEVYDYKNYDIKKFARIIQYIIIGKMLRAGNIIISDDTVTLEVCGFTPFDFEWTIKELTISVDQFTGKYQEYDIVTGLFPLIKLQTYKSLVNKSIQEYFDKIKTDNGYNNSVINFGGYVDARAVYPNSGIFESSRIGEKHEYLQFDTEDLFEDIKDFMEKKKDYIIFSYISPVRLSDDEKLELEKYKIIDEEYYNGVINGWSVLLLGSTGQQVIVPGIVSRRDMLKKISDSFWMVKKEEIKYCLLDGTNVTKDYIEKL
jgi:hypothetical protein